MHHLIYVFLGLFFLVSAPPALAQEAQDSVTSAQLDDVFDYFEMEIITASGASEPLLDAPAPMYVLTRKEIQNRGYTQWSEIMRDLPGFDVAYVGGAPDEFGAYQRGFRSSFFNRTLTLLNGKKFNTLWYQSTPLGPSITVANIERIEILYGPAGAIYGPNAFLGVINIITTDASDLEPNSYELNSSFTAGSWNTRRVDLVAKGKIGTDVSFAISARMNRSDGWNLDGRDNRWSWNEYLGSETIWGDVANMAQGGYDFDKYANPQDDRMLMTTLKVGNFTLEGHAYHLAGSNGAEFAGDHVQAANLWPGRGSSVSLEHEGNIRDNINIKSTIHFREDQRYGMWPDASPSWNEGQEEYSYASMVDWHVKNSSIFFGQNLVWDYSDDFRLSGGYSLERKELTKAFDVGDGYWGAYNSNGPDDNSALYDTYPCQICEAKDADGNVIWTGLCEEQEQAGEVTREVTFTGVTNYETGECVNFDQGALIGWRMPHDNLVLTSDFGGFVEGSYKAGDFKFNLGLRYDINTNPEAAEFKAWDATLHNGYKVFSPRVGIIYRLGKMGVVDAAAIKLLHGRAIQEASPAQLWGGFSARNAVPGLRPEEAQNTELVFLAQIGPFLSDLSLYYATYSKVHVAPTANAGWRQIVGLDYKGRYQFDNPLSSRKISGYLNYSWAKATSSHYYDFKEKDWLPYDGDWHWKNDTGDISPHKVHLGFNLPILENFNLNLRSRYIAKRIPFLANALRDPSRDDKGKPAYFNSYFVFDANISATWENVTLSLVGRNITNKDYNHTGVGEAQAGDDWGSGNTIDTKKRAAGYRNSLIPQPLRNIQLTLKVDL